MSLCEYPYVPYVVKNMSLCEYPYVPYVVKNMSLCGKKTTSTISLFQQFFSPKAKVLSEH
jgi:hypothetical protein